MDEILINKFKIALTSLADRNDEYMRSKKLSMYYYKMIINRLAYHLNDKEYDRFNEILAAICSPKNPNNLFSEETKFMMSLLMPLYREYKLSKL